MIRSATAGDAQAIETIRLDGWRSAYGPLLPAGALDHNDLAAWTARRRRHILTGAGYLVAETGAVRGFCSFGSSRDTDTPTSAEIYALYVDPSAWSAGLGRALLAAALAALHRPVQLWVLRDNGRARRFYAAAGFAVDGASKPFDMYGTELVEIRYRLD